MIDFFLKGPKHSCFGLFLKNELKGSRKDGVRDYKSIANTPKSIRSYKAVVGFLVLC
ncbi:hypothetical protein ADIS_4776 [Lunatimonas lonarensis]|uniref:Uncharacterized protein n=1 Tax=Lunatimonas lonarensis TaxID=1232681 RepID=R7ZL04_9BACT|nr:hypothetical protein ADIS_4776 [Lunatimonas lonarensis]